MAPGKYDLDLYRGDSYRWRFVLWNDDLKTDATDLTGATADAEFRDKSGGAKIVPFDCVVTTPNIIDMTMTPTMWTTAPPDGVWDLQVTFPDGEVRTFVAGDVNVTPDVTDSTVVTTWKAKVVA
jgi:hypothetical protein